jgi:cation diffusion facilitator CzcD-associated flavoprotein CzcO
MPEPQTLPVVVIGAGPIGLAAAAHLASRGERFLVLEAGAAVGAPRPAGGRRPV